MFSAVTVGVSNQCLAYSWVDQLLKAGVQNIELFEFADRYDVVVPGGACPTVGAAGGYLQVRSKTEWL
jgi:hypothetical protein